MADAPLRGEGRPSWWPDLTRDEWVLVATYSLRLAAYACVSVILGIYLAALGFAPVSTGGAIFASSTSAVLLFITAFIGSMSPSGSEVGPFLSIEQAMLPRTTTDRERTKAFSAYKVVGQGVGALGAAASAVPALFGADVVSGEVEVDGNERRPRRKADSAGLRATVFKLAGLLRYAFAQMERPARQSYTMAILPEERRAAASGMMSISRNPAAALAPALWSTAGCAWPGPSIHRAGSIKLVCDAALFWLFSVARRPYRRLLPHQWAVLATDWRSDLLRRK